MGDQIEVFRALKEYNQDKRKHNRKCSSRILERKKIKFESKNKGAHLIVDSPDGKIDFWPSTGLWIVRSTGRRGRGVYKLLNFLGPLR